MSEEIDIRFLLNSPEVERESKRTQDAITGIEKTARSTSKTISSSFSEALIPVEDLSENLRIQKRVLKELEAQYKKEAKKVSGMAPGAAKVEAERQLAISKQEIEDEKKALTELEAIQSRYKQSAESMRTKIRKLKEEMSGMVEGTDEYYRKMRELGTLQDRYGDISKQGQIFADDQKNIRATTEAIQGLSGVMSAGTGVATLFGASQENLAKIQARLQAVMAISIGVNQVAQVVNKDSYFTHIALAKAKDMVTASTTRLSVALGISNAAAKTLMATLTFGLSLAIAGLVVLINRMNKSKAEAMAKDAELHNQVVKTRIEIAQESAEIDKQFRALEKAKTGTKAYEAAKNKILTGYGKYLQGLSTEIRTLQDVEGAYNAVKKAAIDSANARARTAFVSEASQKANEKMAAAMGSIREEIVKSYDKEFLEKFPDQITSIMAEITDALMQPDRNSRQKFIDAGAILEDYGFGKMAIQRVLRGWDLLTTDVKSSYVQDFHLALEELNGIEEVAERVFKTTTPSNEEIAKNKAYWTEQRDNAQAALDAMNETKKGTAEWNEQYKKLALANQKLKLWDFAADPSKLQSKLGQAALQAQVELENARAGVMRDGKEKRLALAESEYRQRLAVIDKEETDLKAQYKAQGKTISQEEKDSFAARRQIADTERANKRFDAEYDYYKQTKTLYDELADVFLTDEQRKTKAIRDRFDEMRNRVNDSVLYDGMDEGTAGKLYARIDQAQQQSELDEALKQFKTYQTQVEETVRDHNDRIVRLRAAGYEAEAQEGERQRDRALRQLSEAMLQESDLWVRLFGDPATKTVAQIKTLIDETRNLYDFLQGKEGAMKPIGFTDQQLEDLKKSPEALKALQDAISKLKQELGQKSPFDQFANEVKTGVDLIKKAFGADGKGIKDVSGGVTVINDAFRAFSPTLEEFGKDLSNIFGDEVGEAIQQAVQLGQAVGDAGSGIAKIVSGDVVGGVMSVVKGIGSVFTMGREAEKRHQQALKEIADARIALQREYNLLLLEQNLLYEEGKNAFGTNELGRATNALWLYRQAIADYKKELKGEAPTQGLFEKLIGKYSKSYQNKLDAYNKGYGALADAKIVTGHKKTGLFGWGKGKDVYSSILEVYPKLVDSTGRLDVALAQSILDTQKMDDSTRNLVQSLIDLQEQADAAREELNAYIQETYGDLGDGIMEALVGGVRSGTDAWLEFGKTGASVLEDLGRQAAYSLYLKNDFDKLQKDLEAVYGSDKSEKQIAYDAMDVVDKFYDTVSGKMDQAEDWLKYWQQRAKDRGFDLWAEDQSAKKEGSSGQLQAQMTEGTASQLVGLWNMTALDIRALKEIISNREPVLGKIQLDVHQILVTTILIEQHTRATSENTKATVNELKQGFQQMSRMLDEIAANTKANGSRR